MYSAISTRKFRSSSPAAVTIFICVSCISQSIVRSHVSIVRSPMTDLHINYYAVVLLKGAYITLLITQLRVTTWSFVGCAAHWGQCRYCPRRKTSTNFRDEWYRRGTKKFRAMKFRRNISKCILQILNHLLANSDAGSRMFILSLSRTRDVFKLGSTLQHTLPFSKLRYNSKIIHHSRWHCFSFLNIKYVLIF